MTLGSDADLDIVLAVARRAAALVLEIYRGDFAVELKGPGDPVTRADREANQVICDELARAFPDAAVVAEESAPTDPAVLSALTRRDDVFFVDPLDGTREFVDRNGEFAVMIGRAFRGRARAGVVVVPVTGQALVGRLDDGRPAVAFVEERDGARRPLHPSTTSDPRQATLVSSRSHRPRVADRVRERLAPAREIVCGSVGVKVARVALGQADVYVHGGRGAKLWDSCAPEAILNAAGGRFTDLDGNPVDYAASELGLPRGIVATNGALHPAVLRAVMGE